MTGCPRSFPTCRLHEKSPSGERIPTNVFLETLVGLVYGEAVTYPDVK